MWDTTRTITIFYQVWKMSVTKRIILFQCASAVISHYISGAGDSHNHHLINNDRLQAQNYLKYVLNYYLTGNNTDKKASIRLTDSSNSHVGLLAWWCIGGNPFKTKLTLNKCLNQSDLRYSKWRHSKSYRYIYNSFQLCYFLLCCKPLWRQVLISNRPV